MIERFGSLTSGLGDVLLLTSLCKYFPGRFTIQLPSKVSRFSILFDGLANVEISDDVDVIPDVGSGHYATTKLRNLFGSSADHLDNRPLVLHFNLESELWVRSYLSKFTNPIILVTKCAKAHDKTRSLPHALSAKIFEDLKGRGFTPILCQSSSNPDTSLDCEKLTDIDLSKYVALLRACGRYVGANTGDMHLAVGLGCLVNVYQPKSGGSFWHNNWNYNHPLVAYNTFQDDFTIS